LKTEPTSHPEQSTLTLHVVMMTNPCMMPDINQSKANTTYHCFLSGSSFPAQSPVVQKLKILKKGAKI